MKTTNKSHYAQVLAHWRDSPVKLGPPSTEQQFATAHSFAPRGAGKQSLGFAMALRDCGMTRPQMLHAAHLYDVHTGSPTPRGTPCLNQFTIPVQCGELEAGLTKGLIKYTLTPKGEARLARTAQLLAAKAPPAPVKAPKAKAVKVRAKANKAKAVKVRAKANKAKAIKASPSTDPVEHATMPGDHEPYVSIHPVTT